jgi:hypothetical protein
MSDVALADAAVKLFQEGGKTNRWSGRIVLGVLLIGLAALLLWIGGRSRLLMSYEEVIKSTASLGPGTA